jgi:CRP-like cAMP-binding protein
VRDPNEVPRELAQLGKNAHFGEIALLTAEPRSATITVMSPDAKCLRMTKQKFEELLATTNQIQAENRKQIGRDVLEEVPLLKSLTNVNKKKLLDAMISITYLPQTYICRQGTAGNTFYILTEGTCKVTVNERDGSEKEVAKLHPGDFFGMSTCMSPMFLEILLFFCEFILGEVALIESSNRRTANVISIENVSCLTLNRNDFNRLLKSLKVKIIEQQAARSSSNSNSNNHDSNENEVRQLNTLSKKRRISGYNTHGQRDELRIASLLKRFAKFSTEALWNSLYSRMYREMLLDTSKVAEYGKYATFIMRSNDTRYEAVKAINDQVVRILETDPSRRNPTDHSFIYGLMRQRNFMKDRLCRSWPQHQFIMLCKRMKILRVKPFRKVRPWVMH